MHFWNYFSICALRYIAGYIFGSELDLHGERGALCERSGSSFRTGILESEKAARTDAHTLEEHRRNLSEVPIRGTSTGEQATENGRRGLFIFP